MIEFMFGEEKSANPQPKKSNVPISIHNGVVLVRSENENSDSAVIAIPVVARILGSILSESLPVNGVSTAMTRGCAIRIVPASMLGKPLTL